MAPPAEKIDEKEEEEVIVTFEQLACGFFKDLCVYLMLLFLKKHADGEFTVSGNRGKCGK